MVVSRDIHSGLRTERVAAADLGGFAFTKVKHQWAKDDVAFSLHAAPRQFTRNGLQLSDFLVQLGFHRGACPYIGGECYGRAVPGDLDADAFAQALSGAYQSLSAAERSLNECGIPFVQTEGWGYFYGRAASGGYRRAAVRGDGHTAAEVKQLKVSEDDNFQYAFSWLIGNDVKGWTTHYRPKHPPLSPELLGVFEFLGLTPFDSCPEFDFESCHWRHVAFESRGDSFFDANTDYVNQNFDKHSDQFSIGVENLLKANALVEPFGMSFLHFKQPPETRRRDEINRRVTPATPTRSPAETIGPFDVAISFAGAEREPAERLAHLVRDAGFAVFYDDFYPEMLWGKNLYELFDAIYRKLSRFCVIFCSAEYAQRMWTNHERQSAQARALEEKGKEYILPIRVDATEIPGVLPTTGHLRLAEHDIDAIAEVLVRKLSA